MKALSYPLHNSHMLKSQLINSSVSAKYPPSDSYTEQAAEQPRGEIVDFSHGGENDLRRARIPLGTALHERPTPTFPFCSLMSSRICTLVDCRTIKRTTTNRSWHVSSRKSGAERHMKRRTWTEMSQTSARVAIVYLSSSCNSDARDISLGLLRLALRCLRE